LLNEDPYELANERDNARKFREYIEDIGSPNLEDFGVSANSNWTRSGLPTFIVPDNGNLIRRVQLAQGADGFDCINFYIGTWRAYHVSLGFEYDDPNRYEVFSWAAPIAAIAYDWSYSRGGIQGNAAIVRTLNWVGRELRSVEDDTRGEPILPVFPQAQLSIPQPPTSPPIPRGKTDAPMESDHRAPESLPIPPIESVPLIPASLEITGEHTLQDKMRRPRTEQLEVHLNTLQGRQYDLISRSGHTNLLVQGSPGTGKTIVAAHRVAYLVNPDAEANGFAEEGKTTGRVLLVGPSKAYKRHVSKILVDLGCGSETYSIISIEELFGGLLKSASFGQFTPNYQPPSTFGIGHLYFDSELYLIAAEAAEQFERDYEISYRASLITETSRSPGKPKLSELSFGKRVERCYEFFRDSSHSLGIIEASIRNNFGASDEDQEDFHELVAHRVDRWRVWVDKLPAYDAAGPEYQWFVACLAWHLEPGSEQDLSRVQHIVVDEVQDLHPVEWEFLKLINIGRNWTLVGDFNQKSAEHGVSDWKILSNHLSISQDIESLDLGFRSTSSIMALAKSVIGAAPSELRSLQLDGKIPRAIKVHPSRVIDSAMNEVDTLKAFQPDGLLAVVLPAPLRESFEDWLLLHGWRRDSQEHRWIHPDRLWSLESALWVATPVDVRGLEFDGVVIVQPTQMASRRQLYMGITRANRYLHIVHSQALPPEIHKWVDSSPVI
jgi:DNA helicase-2/ATP-dependent DNA helicase PcrA